MIELHGLQRACHLLDLVEQVPALKASMFVGLQDEGGELQLKLSAEVAVSVTLKQALGLSKPKAVDRRLLIPFVQNKGTYKAEVQDDDHLLLRQGHRKAKIPLVDLDWNYGDWQLKKNTPVTLSPGLLRAIRCAGMCSADKSILPELAGVYIEFGKQAMVFAANDLVMCHGRADYEGAVKTMVVPVPLISALVKENVNKVFVKERVVGFELDGARVWSQAPEKAWVDFPADRLKRLVLTSRKGEPNFIVPTEDFAFVCKRFTGYLSGCGTDGTLTLETTDKGKLKMKLNAGGFANFEDQIKADIKQPLPETEINLAVADPVFDFLRGKDIAAQFTSLENVQHIKVEDFEFLFSTRM